MNINVKDGNLLKTRTKRWHETVGKWQQVLNDVGKTVGSTGDCGKLGNRGSTYKDSLMQFHPTDFLQRGGPVSLVY